MPMTISELLQRARSASDKNVQYELGAGGMIPSTPTPANFQNRCDCSGYVCWCLGISRKTEHPLYLYFNGGWINTDSIVHDANSPTGFFRILSEPRVGCLIVFPSPSAGHYGHVGIVTDTSNGQITSVIHCSNGNNTTFGDAIRETPPTVFQGANYIFAWYEGIIEES